MAKITQTLFTAIVAVALSLMATPVDAQAVPNSMTIAGDGIGDGAWRSFAAIPVGKTVKIRLVGKDKKGMAMKLNSRLIVWKMKARHKDFSMTVVNGVARITAHADAFGRLGTAPKKCPKPESCTEPTTWLMANYGSLTVGVQLLGAMDAVGKWTIHSGKDRIPVHIVHQSGRWVVDSKGQKESFMARA